MLQSLQSTTSRQILPTLSLTALLLQPIQPQTQMLPTWLNVSCRCRNWNISCPNRTSNFSLCCIRLHGTGCPKLCLDMKWHKSTQVSHQHADRHLPSYRKHSTGSLKTGKYKLSYTMQAGQQLHHFIHIETKNRHPVVHCLIHSVSAHMRNVFCWGKSVLLRRICQAHTPYKKINNIL